MSHSSPLLTDVHGMLKPKLRGLVHAWSAIPMTIAGMFLIALTPTMHARLAVAVYTLAITGMLTASATYHRLRVGERARNWLRRLDHSMIGVAVAGTYTPVIVMVAEGSMRVWLLAILWTGALGSMIISFAWPSAPNWLRALVYLALGWGGAAVMPWLWTHGGVAAFVLVLVGAALYSVGAAVYAGHRPNPWPTTFGFHEIFHTLVVLAVVTHFIAVAFVVHNAA